MEISVKKILDDYCDKHRITQAEGVRRAILKLKEDNEERSDAHPTKNADAVKNSIGGKMLREKSSRKNR